MTHDRFATLRAAFTVYRRRKGALVLFVVLVGVLAVTLWGSYAIIRDQRRTLADLKNGRLQFFNLPLNCDSSSCHMALPNGQPFGPSFDSTLIQGDNGQPPDPQKLQDFFARNRAQIVDGLERISFELNKDF